MGCLPRAVGRPDTGVPCGAFPYASIVCFLFLLLSPEFSLPLNGSC